MNTNKQARHCCACLFSSEGKPVYCHIGKGFFCARHKRWYKRRDELHKIIQKAEMKLDTHYKRF